MQKVVIFDVWSHFAFFRRHYTTTTASSHPFITRSAVEGLVGAICGYKSEDYPSLLWDAKIAIALQSHEDSKNAKVTKFPFGITYTHSDFWTQQVGKYLKKGGGQLNYKRAPRSIEILEEPMYRIYFSTDNADVYSNFSDNLKRHITHYTPYLGSSNMIANFKLFGEYSFSLEQTKENAAALQSILPFFKNMPRVKAESGSFYAVEQNIPLHVGSDRKASGYYSAVYSPKYGQRILASEIQYYRVNSGGNGVNIVFIPTAPSAA